MQSALDRSKRIQGQGLCLHCGRKRNSTLTLGAACRDMFHKAHKKYYDKINKNRIDAQQDKLKTPSLNPIEDSNISNDERRLTNDNENDGI